MSDRVTVRYLTGTNEDFARPPIAIGNDDWRNPQGDVRRYAVAVPLPWTWGNDDFARPPIGIGEDYWIDPQQDVERYVVTVPLPWSWEPSDSITSFLTVQDEDGDLVRPLAWKKWVTPQPWTFDGLYRAAPPAAIAHAPLNILLAASHLNLPLSPSIIRISLSPSILTFPLSSNEE